MTVPEGWVPHFKPDAKVVKGSFSRAATGTPRGPTYTLPPSLSLKLTGVTLKKLRRLLHGDAALFLVSSRSRSNLLQIARSCSQSWPFLTSCRSLSSSSHSSDTLYSTFTPQFSFDSHLSAGTGYRATPSLPNIIQVVPDIETVFCFIGMACATDYILEALAHLGSQSVVADILSNKLLMHLCIELNGLRVCVRPIVLQGWWPFFKAEIFFSAPTIR